MKDYEREMSKYHTVLETKETTIKDLQRKFDEQTKQIKSTVDLINPWQFCVYHLSCVCIFLARTTYNQSEQAGETNPKPAW